MIDRSLSRRQRTVLLFISASAYLASFSGLGNRIDARGLARDTTSAFAFEPRRTLARIGTIIVRDPFAGAPQRRALIDEIAGAPSVSNSVTRSSDIAIDTTIPDIATAVDDRVANARNIVGEAAASILVVRATIVGRNPVAYIANGSAMDIVRVGDRLGDRRIVSIDIRGIAFSDGTRLDLPGAFVASPARVRPGSSSITIKLDDLRRLLARERPSPAPHSATTRPVAMPTPASSFPSPGPLPTVDARGIPAGSNPTPNASGPTPYPIPYPYAPPHR